MGNAGWIVLGFLALVGISAVAVITVMRIMAHREERRERVRRTQEMPFLAEDEIAEIEQLRMERDDKVREILAVEDPVERSTLLRELIAKRRAPKLKEEF